jgi:hypothetical protein
VPIFSGLTFGTCQLAFENILLPAIKSAAMNRQINKYAGCLVVLDPSIPYESKYKNAIEDHELFDDLVLWEDHFYEGDHDIEKYIKIARTKAFTSYLTGLPSHQVQQAMPSLYVPGMTKWGGSAVAGVGPMRLIVAFSGVQWYYDQMISEMMISAIQALCHEQMVDVMASDDAFIMRYETGTYDSMLP